MLTSGDLKKFCWRDKNSRPYLRGPWSRDGFTYATNGHVVVRIDRLGDVAENEKAPDCEKIFAGIADQVELLPIPAFEIPKVESEDCEDCEGRGMEHDCPDCGCECESCEGTGQAIEKFSVTLFGVIYDAGRIKLIQSLPGLLFSARPPEAKAARFIFEGGDGAIMPRVVARDRHIEVSDAAV
jgi:hypothetical protein